MEAVRLRLFSNLRNIRHARRRRGQR